MPLKFKFMLLVAVLIAYGSLPRFDGHASISDIVSGLGIALVGVALMVLGVCLYHRNPVWEHRTAASGPPFLEFVSVWKLRERMLRRLAFICVGSGVGVLIAVLAERAPA